MIINETKRQATNKHASKISSQSVNQSIISQVLTQTDWDLY